MDKTIKIQIEIQPAVVQALNSGDYSQIFEALKKINKAEGKSNGKDKLI